jgi:hypothetical protein
LLIALSFIDRGSIKYDRAICRAADDVQACWEGSALLDIHLLQGDDRLGAVLDAEFSERWA